MSSRKQRNEQLRRRRRRRNVYLVTITATIVVAVVVAIAANGTGNDQTATSSETHAVTVSGEPLPPLDGATDDPAVGRSIPTVQGTGVDRDPMQIADDGRAKVLLFAAHWCPHCRKEMPLLAEGLRSQPLPSTVDLITVSTGVNPNAPNYPPSAWLADLDWAHPVLTDDGNSTAAAAFGLPGYPYFVFVDAQNRVVSRASGELGIEEFRTRVAALAT
jgi:thiol-disulfide isomerase/thioredoxin